MEISDGLRRRKLRGSVGVVGVAEIGVGGEVSIGFGSSAEEGEVVTLTMKADMARKANFDGLAKLRRRRSCGT